MSQNALVGKKVNFKFRLSKCYDSCLTCTELSKDNNAHKCLHVEEVIISKKV